MAIVKPTGTRCQADYGVSLGLKLDCWRLAIGKATEKSKHWGCKYKKDKKDYLKVYSA